MTVTRTMHGCGLCGLLVFGVHHDLCPAGSAAVHRLVRRGPDHDADAVILKAMTRAQESDHVREQSQLDSCRSEAVQ